MTDEQPSSKLAALKVSLLKIYNNITVEPLIICWLLPFLLTYAAIENMNFEKACRELVTVEKPFNKDVCKLFVRKDEYNITCVENSNSSSFSHVKVEEIQERYPEIYASYNDNSNAVYQFLCDAEKEVQEKLSVINSIRNPISSIGPLVIILFAGPYSDKKNLRVPCMLIPYIGEAIGYLTLFIAAIFINGPVEFPAYAYRLLPSLTGAENLMVLGIFSYLSAISSEEDRTFRFGIFQILMTIIPIIAQSISPTLIRNYEYAELFGCMIPVHVFGFLYAILYLKEVKVNDKMSYDNPAMSIDVLPNDSDVADDKIVKSCGEKLKTSVLEFFNPEHAIKCITSLLKNRENQLRTIIILFMLMHLVCNGISQGEAQNLFLYVRAKLTWDVDTYVYHNVFTAVCGLIGTSFAVGILSKIFKIPDIFLVLLSTFFSIICRGVYIVATTTLSFFIGTAIDFTFSIKFLAARSIISKIVPSDELSTMFAIMGLFEAIAGFVFPFIYPVLYQFLLKSSYHDISEIFLLSGLLLIIAFVIYLYDWYLLKLKEKSENDDEEKEEQDTKL